MRQQVSSHWFFFKTKLKVWLGLQFDVYRLQRYRQTVWDEVDEISSNQARSAKVQKFFGHFTASIVTKNGELGIALQCVRGYSWLDVMLWSKWTANFQLNPRVRKKQSAVSAVARKRISKNGLLFSIRWGSPLEKFSTSGKCSIVLTSERITNFLSGCFTVD